MRKYVLVFGKEQYKHYLREAVKIYIAEASCHIKIQVRERRTANHPRGNSRAEIKARSVVTGEMREREGEPKGSSKNKNEDEDNQYVVSRPVRPVHVQIKPINQDQLCSE